LAWIKSHQTLQRHPKVIIASSMLGVPRIKLIGHLHCLWWWALDFASADGCLGKNITKEMIAVAAEFPVKKADLFVESLLHCGQNSQKNITNPETLSANCSHGFLEIIDGIYYLHDWQDYAGGLTESRGLTQDQNRIGGKNRMAKLTPEERHRLAQQASHARWDAKTHLAEMPSDLAEMPSRVEGDKSYIGSSTSTSSGEGKIAEFARLYQNTCGDIYSITLKEDIIAVSEEYTVEWFEAACRVATDASSGSRPSLAFVKSILERWRKQGFRAPLRGNNARDIQKTTTKPQANKPEEHDPYDVPHIRSGLGIENS